MVPLIEHFVDECIVKVEARRPETRERISDVDEATLGSCPQDAEPAREDEVTPTSLRRARASSISRRSAESAIAARSPRSSSAVTALSWSCVADLTCAQTGGFDIHMRTGDGDAVARSSAATASGMTTSP
jgi:hypothetical protein